MIDPHAGAAFAADSPTTAADPDPLQAHFQEGIAPDEIEQVFHLKRAQPMLSAFTALFHGTQDGVLVRLLVLRELAGDTASSAFSRADINQKLAYLIPESLETVLNRLRGHGLLAWDAPAAVYRITPLARNVLSALETRLLELTEEFRDAIASGSEFRLRTSQAKWHMACDWVEKGSVILRAITSDERADSATHRAAQAIGRAQSALLNMQGMFSRALNQIERQRVHLGQSGLSTTDVKRWLLAHDDLASLAAGAIDRPVTPLFATPAEMIDVAETELMAQRVISTGPKGLPSGQDAPLTINDNPAMMIELNDWINKLADFANLGNFPEFSESGPKKVQLHESLLPASFAVASYRASLLPLLGDAAEASLQGATAELARLPLAFEAQDKMIALDDPEVAAMSIATLSLNLDLNLDLPKDSGTTNE